MEFRNGLYYDDEGKLIVPTFENFVAYFKESFADPNEHLKDEARADAISLYKNFIETPEGAQAEAAKDYEAMYHMIIRHYEFNLEDEYDEMLADQLREYLGLPEDVQYDPNYQWDDSAFREDPTPAELSVSGFNRRRENAPEGGFIGQDGIE